MGYSVEETEVENTERLEAIEVEEEVYSEGELENMFIESLDENGTVDAGGLTFDVSQIWKEMDPTAYRCGLNDFESDRQETEIKYQCPICGGECDDEDEAKDCCQDEYITKYIIIDDEGEEYDNELVFDDEAEAEEYIADNLED